MLTELVRLATALNPSAIGQAETRDYLTITGELSTDGYRKWKKAANELPEGLRITITSDGQDVLASTESELTIPCTATVSIHKTGSHGLRFFTEQALRRFLEESEEAHRCSEIRVAGEFEKIVCSGLVISAWSHTDGNVTQIGGRQSVDPRRFGRDLTSRIIPPNLSSWLLADAMPASSTVLSVWSSVSARRLIASLADAVWSEDRIDKIALGNEPRLRFELPKVLQVDAELMDAVTSATRWVFSDSQGCDVRFVFYKQELARVWRGTEIQDQYADLSRRALDGAKTAYGLHLREGGEKTVRLLGDLRKALAEDVSKIAQQSRDVVGALWKDMVVALTAIVARILLVISEKPMAHSKESELAMYATAVFLCLNATAMYVTNYRFGQLTKRTLDGWRTELYQFVADAQWDLLAKRPLEDARALYKQTAWTTAVIYAATVAVLLQQGLATSKSRRQARSAVTVAKSDSTIHASTAPAITPRAIQGDSQRNATQRNVQTRKPAPSQRDSARRSRP